MKHRSPVGNCRMMGACSGGGDPNYTYHVPAYKDIATFEDRIYGVGFIPDESVLAWNKTLFREAGLDPEKPPQTVSEIQKMAAKIGALGDETYGFYLSGLCPGCRIFVTSSLDGNTRPPCSPKERNNRMRSSAATTK